MNIRLQEMKKGITGILFSAGTEVCVIMDAVNDKKGRIAGDTQLIILPPGKKRLKGKCSKGMFGDIPAGFEPMPVFQKEGTEFIHIITHLPNKVNI